MTTAVRPTPGTPRPYQFPRFETHTIENGLRVIVAPARKLPLVSLMLVVDAGSTAEPINLAGVAALTARVLLEGTESMSGDELTARVESLGASLHADADWDAATIGMTVLSSHLTSALKLLGDVVRAPAFPAREVDRHKAERLADILQLRTEPRGLADEMFDRFVYDEASRFAAAERGSASSISSLERADLVRFYGERYRPGAATLILVGDVSVEEGVARARDAFGAWSGATPAVSATTDLPARRTRAVHIVEKSDAPQSELRIGHVGVPRTSADYFPITLMNAVLGGLFSSRINLNLREAHGYTYGAFSRFDWRRAAGPFTVASAVRTDVTALAAIEVLAEIVRIRAEPVTASELSLAADYLGGVFPIRYESVSDIAGALAAFAVYGLPIDYFDTYRANIASVTADDILRAAQTHLRPEELQLVAVGEPSAIRASVDEMKFGPVTIYDADGSIIG